MGWADCGEDDLGRPIGYAYENVDCDFGGCSEKINRGVSSCCGGMHGDGGVGDQPGCPRYYCGEHHDPEDHDCPEHEAWAEYYELSDLESAIDRLEAAILSEPWYSWRHQLGLAAAKRLSAGVLGIAAVAQATNE